VRNKDKDTLYESKSPRRRQGVKESAGV